MKTTGNEMSAATRAKHFVVAFVGQLEDNKELAKLMDKGTLAEVQAIAKELGDLKLPLSVQLTNAKREQGAHYATVQVVNGKPDFTPEWIAKNNTLSAEIARLEKAIAAQKERAKAKQAETATAGNNKNK